jgi:cytochrome c2
LEVDSYLGPSLGKIYNATAGSRKGYKKDYSLAFKSASFKWTE